MRVVGQHSGEKGRSLDPGRIFDAAKGVARRFGGALLTVSLVLCLLPPTAGAQAPNTEVILEHDGSIQAMLSADGRFLLYAYAPGTRTELWLYDRTTQTSELLLSESAVPGGRIRLEFNAHNANASNGARVIPLKTDAEASGRFQVFVFDRDLGAFELVSRTPTGVESDGASENPVITPDGRFVAFDSDATDLVPGAGASGRNVYLYDRNDQSVRLVSRNLDGTANDGVWRVTDISDDGSHVVFVSDEPGLIPNDTNGDSDVFLYDVTTGLVTRLNEPDGEESTDAGNLNPAISGDGQVVTWVDNDRTLDPAKTGRGYQFFLKDLNRGPIALISRSVNDGEPNDGMFPSDPTAVSNFGRFAFFVHEATNLVADDVTLEKDLFVLDRSTGEISIASIDENGEPVGTTSNDPSRPTLDVSGNRSVNFGASDDGRIVTFVAQRPNSFVHLLYLRDRGDVVAPVISNLRTQPADPDTINEADVLATATDASSLVGGAEYQIDRGAWLPLSASDGAFDEMDEPVEVTLRPDVLGTGHHEVCVRATDDLGNTSMPACIDVGEICDNAIDDDGDGSIDGTDEDCQEILVQVACLHEPLHPAPGDTVTIEANVIDDNGVPTSPDVIQIFVDDKEVPAEEAFGQSSASLTTTAQDPTFFYGCATRRGSGELETNHFTGWRRVDVGDREILGIAAVPVFYTGPLDRKIDIVFFNDKGDFTGPGDPNFDQAVHDLIEQGLFTIPFFVEFQRHFNFWLATVEANSGPDPDDDDPSDGITCLREPPDVQPAQKKLSLKTKYNRVYGFADSAGIVHTTPCRDNAGNKPPMFTIQAGANPQVLAHEMGHRPFGLADEYITTTAPGGYFHNDPDANLYKEEPGCRRAAERRNVDPDVCRSFNENRPFPRNRDWWIFEPDFRGTSTGDLMQQTNSYRVNDSESGRMGNLLSDCRSGEC